MKKNTIYVGGWGLVIILSVSFFLLEKKLSLNELLVDDWKINIKEVNEISMTYYDNSVNNILTKDLQIDRKEDIEKLLLSSETMQLKKTKNNREFNEKHYHIIVRLTDCTQVSFWMVENIIFNSKSTYQILDENTCMEFLKQLVEVN